MSCVCNNLPTSTHWIDIVKNGLHDTESTNTLVLSSYVRSCFPNARTQGGSKQHIVQMRPTDT